MSSSSQAYHAYAYPSPEAQDEEIRRREIETVHNYVAGYIHEYPSSSLDYILGPPQLNFNGQKKEVENFLGDLIWIYMESCRDRLSWLLVAIVRRGAPDNAIISNTVRMLNAVLFRTHDHIGRNVPASWIPYCSFIGKFIHDDSMSEGGALFPRSPVIGILWDVFGSRETLNTCGLVSVVGAATCLCELGAVVAPWLVSCPVLSSSDIWNIKRQRITSRDHDHWIMSLRRFENNDSQALEYRHLAGMAAGLLDTAKEAKEAARKAANRAACKAAKEAKKRAG
ncbi:hypothetical protein F5Y07DRAFT_407713 [Xylaria sp. FL0933]|nr:hypothetical protein F5Y07DRAFT_407713 [Xylaria sp. FL0933]